MINKPFAGQSELKSVHIYNDGRVRCIGTDNPQGDYADYSDWPKAKIDIIHAAVALIAADVGGYEGEDQEAIITAMDEAIAEIKAAKIIEDIKDVPIL